MEIDKRYTERQIKNFEKIIENLKALRMEKYEDDNSIYKNLTLPPTLSSSEFET